MQRHAVSATGAVCTAAALSNATDVCEYARSACGEVGVGIFGSYIAVWHCELGGLVAMLPLLAVWLVVIIYVLGTTADYYLVPQLNYLSALLKLSPDVAGVTLLAFGNGAPDVFTGIAVATQSEEMDLSLLLSDLVGGSLFIMTVVIGAIIWIANSRSPGWRVDKLPFWRDGLSFVVALSVVAIVAADGTVYLSQALGLLGLYVLYIGLVLALPWLLHCFGVAPAADASETNGGTDCEASATSADKRRAQTPTPAENDEKAAAPLPGLDWEPGTSMLEKALFLASLPLSLLRTASIPSSDGLWDQRRRLWTVATPPLGALAVLLLVQGEIRAAAAARVGSSALPVAVLLLLLGALGSAALWLATSGGAPPRWLAALVAAGFVMTIVWLNLLANEMVALVEAFGVMLGVSTSILGLTVRRSGTRTTAILRSGPWPRHLSHTVPAPQMQVIAIGNSAGDLVTDAAAARGADARMAMAACFGSPLVMNLLGVGISLSLRLLTMSGAPVHATVSSQCRLAYVLLCGSLLAHLVTFPCAGYRAPRAYAVCLFAAYAVFLLVSCLAETGAVRLDFLCGQAWPCPEEAKATQRLWRRTRVASSQAAQEQARLLP